MRLWRGLIRDSGTVTLSDAEALRQATGKVVPLRLLFSHSVSRWGCSWA